MDHLLVDKHGVPAENQPLTPHQQGKARALALKVGEVLCPAYFYAVAAGFNIAVDSTQEDAKPAWEFIDGFIEALGEIGISTDRGGRIISFAVVKRGAPR